MLFCISFKAIASLPSAICSQNIEAQHFSSKVQEKGALQPVKASGWLTSYTPSNPLEGFYSKEKRLKHRIKFCSLKGPRNTARQWNRVR